ncbi:FtsX-like permease family protein [Nocardioides currus]|uniref:Permease n=1 Tax=Nocardioides currus TaxID=2133958 RepID=A0A2R7YRS8_9ACTN|nr:FtsX-like permease family protein [Nocardioides currus]PUA79061.1 permease [Nocardioides currus]
MLGLVLRRASVQRRLLASVVLLVATAATLVGVCSLVLTTTADRAFHVAVERSQPSDLSVTAYVVELAGDDVADVRDEADRVVGDVLAATDPRLETTAVSRLRLLEDGERQAYLTTTDDLESRAVLVSGRWPGESAAPYEAVVPATTARLLDLALGDELVLGREIGLGGLDDPVTVEVVGTFRPRSQADWEGDPLSGAGFSATYSNGLEAAPTYGPFVVTETSFLATGSSVGGLRVTGHPSPARATDSALRGVVDGLDDASGVLAAGAGDRARLTRVASDLSVTLARLHAQQDSTRATVLVVLLLGVALALAAALLAGWLVASVREAERDLLVAMGLSRRQRIAAAGGEALLLSLVATVLAVPAAAVMHARLTHLPDLAAAGLARGPAFTWPLVAAVLAAAVLLTTTLVATTLGGVTDPGPATRRSVLARLGAGPLLLAAAALAWWQLRSQSPTAAGSNDVTLTVAPVLAIAALTVLGVRLVPFVLVRAAGVGTRSRSFVWPLATQQAARRPHAGTAMVLVGAAVAAAVFGVALRSTWERSQVDQADLRVGTDLALALAAPAGTAEAARVEEATDAESTVSPVVHRPLALGRFVGTDASRPVLLAVDTRESGALLRGRTGEDRSWAEAGGGLAPDTAVAGVPLPGGGEPVTLRGESAPGTALTAVPTAVVEDGSGFRSTVSAGVLPLDGAAHPVRWLAPLDPGLRLVGLRLELDGYAGEEPTRDRTEVAVVVDVPATGREGAVPPPWRLLPLQDDSPVAGATMDVRSTEDGDATELTATFGLDLEYFSYSGADLLATAFPATTSIPVVASQALVDTVGARVGDRLSAVVDGTTLTLEVRGVVPAVPSAPAQVAVLADVDAVSRALIDAGRLDPVVDSWWVADPSPATVDALRDLGLGEVTLRQDVAQQLTQGPLRVAVPTTLLTLVALAAALLLAGVGLVLGAERQRRSAEVVRLRALGLSRRSSRRLLLAEHLAFFVPTIVVGALVGVVATVLLGPDLVRSDLGAAPVPSAVVAWPWTSELLLLSGLLGGTVVVTTALTVLHVRASDPSRLRGAR